MMGGMDAFQFVDGVLHSEAVSLPEVADAFGFDRNLVEKIQFSDLAGLDLAPRPVDSSYDISKIQAFGVTCRGPKEGLWRMHDAGS